MATTQVQCPGCGARLNVQFPDGTSVMTIACPNCGRSLQLRLAGSGDAAAGGDDGETVIGNAPRHQQPVPHSVSLNVGGVSYPLQPGDNIVGRKSATSRATVPLAVNDEYMSRQHVRVSVKQVPGGRIVVTLANYRNTNKTIVDGREVRDGDEVVLHNGSTLVLGNTTLTCTIL